MEHLGKHMCGSIYHHLSSFITINLYSPQKVGEYKAYINQYKVTVPSTFTLV